MKYVWWYCSIISGNLMCGFWSCLSYSHQSSIQQWRQSTIYQCSHGPANSFECFSMHTPKKCCVHVNIREGLQFNAADQWHPTDPISAWNYGTMWSIPDNIIPQLHPMGHVNNIPTMQCFTGNSRNTQSNSYMLSLTECVWEIRNNALWDIH